jgi:phthiocerol/phenolphthiocerol synthesis type-I polyketide synthase C
MALELRNRLEATLGITLPVALVWAYPTIAGLASALCERMGYETASESRSAEPEEPDVVLSDDELDLLDALVEASELEATTGVNE